MAKSEIAISVKSCSECEKHIKGVDIYNTFRWCESFAIAFDNETNEIVFSEEQLMRIIQMVNPAQQTRKIRLSSQEEVLELLGG
jgi:hypothetical protein